MRTLNFKVKGQSLSKDPKCDFNNIMSGSKNYLLLKFDFSEDLLNFKKVACFVKGYAIEYVPIINDCCFVPENITDSHKISFFITFVDNDIKFESNKISIKQEVNVNEQFK